MTHLYIVDKESDLNFQFRVGVGKLCVLDSLRLPDRVFCSFNRKAGIARSPVIAFTDLASDLISHFASDTAYAEAATCRVLDVLALDLIYHVMV